MATPLEPLILVDALAWRGWLDENEDSSDGVWLLLAKKGVTVPTSLSYAEALDEALCSGWIDGQRRGFDDTTFLQRFTPRRSASIWSARNVDFIARLQAEGRLRARGSAEVDRAKASGRWDAAYAGPATMQVPDDLTAALDADPRAAAAFAALKSQARYSILHALATAATAPTRQRRLAKALNELSAPAIEDN